MPTASPHHHHHHNGTTRNPRGSTKITFPTRLFKFLWTIYLLLAITYTSTFIIILPIFKIIFKGNLINQQYNNSESHSNINSNISIFQSPVIQIVPRLLPNQISKNYLVDHLKIRKNLKGTSVNTDEVIAEDEASLWTTQTSKVSLEVIPSNSLRRTNDEQLLFTNRVKYNMDSNKYFSENIEWYKANHELSRNKFKQENKNNYLTESIRKSSHNTSEDFFLSKAFGDSLGPSKIIPFFYRAIGPKNDGKIQKKDISITTLVTSNRFKVFSKLVENYNGPISVTIHVSDTPEILKPLLQSIDELYNSSKSMSTWVDIHLVVDRFDRQFNMWRNVAKFFARTDYVMMLDVDFWICTNFRERIINTPKLINQLESGKSAFVIPAFEYTKQSNGVNPNEFPSNKFELMKLIKLGQIGMFHKSWKPGHASTNYTRFYLASHHEDFYPASRYSHSYEPYVIYKRDQTPFCDERFIGYGANKAACIFELYLSGVSFLILPQEFLIHQSHAYAEKTRHHERRFNRRLYHDFREEVCFRYFNNFLKHGSILEKGKNMFQECQKINGFSEAAIRIAKTNQVSINFN